MALPDYSGVVYTFDTYKADALGVEDPAANGPAYAERQFLNFDGIEGVEARQYKTIRSIFPIGRIPDGSAPVQFSWAAVDHAGDAAFDLSTKLPYDSKTEGQLHHMAFGRYHAIRIDYSDVRLVKITGFNLDIDVEGYRG